MLVSQDVFLAMQEHILVAVEALLARHAPHGYYQPLQNQSACNLCPAGSYQDNVGQTSCKICPPGTYQSQIGSTVHM